MDINKFDINQLVKFINEELKRDTTLSVSKLCKRLNLKKSTIITRLKKHNYAYNAEMRQYIRLDTTSNTTKNFEKSTITQQCNTTSNIMINSNDIDIDKLKVLLDNFDLIMNKITPNQYVICNTTETQVTSLRINKEIYKLIKDRANSNNTSISDIVNRALIDYLNNYI